MIGQKVLSRVLVSVIPILLFTLSSVVVAPAFADELILSGGYVTEIADLNIDGTLYNVTFATTDDTTFATNGEAFNAASDIVAALGTNSIVSSITYNGGVQLFCVDTGGGDCQDAYQYPPGTTWITIGPNISGGLNPASPAFGAGAYYAEFSPAETIPEPSSAILAFIGIGLLGLMMVLRNRKSLAAPRAT